MSENTAINKASAGAKPDAAPRSWWQRLLHGSFAASVDTHGNRSEPAAPRQGAEVASASGIAQFDRYQLCHEGVVVCQNGWELYRVHSEAELLEANLGRISILQRLCACNSTDFNFYLIPLIKVMTRYCLMLPASEGSHDAEVGGLVKHNLQVAIVALDVISQSEVITINDSVRLSSRLEREQAMRQLDSFLQTEADSLADSDADETEISPQAKGAMGTMGANGAAATKGAKDATEANKATGTKAAGNGEEQADTLARYIQAANSSSDDPAMSCMNEMELGNFQQKVVSSLQEWRQRINARLQGILSSEQQGFILKAMVIFHCFAHDLSKLLYDMEIVASNGQRYNPYVATLAQFCQEQQCPYVLVRYIKNRSDSHKLGLADGYFLLGRMNNHLLVLFSQLQTIGSMLVEPEPVLNQLLILVERNLITNEMQMQSVGKMYLPTYVSALLKQLQAARVQDGMLPNEIESDYYTSGNHVLVQNNSRSWALFSWWVQEKEFGPMAFHEQSNASLVNRVLLTANVSRVLQQFTSKAMYFMVFVHQSLLLVRGIDLYGSGLSFTNDVTIVPTSVKHPLMQQALYAIVLALYHQRQANLNAISAEAKANAKAAAESTEAAETMYAPRSIQPNSQLNQEPRELSDSPAWQAEELRHLHFVADPSLANATMVASTNPAPEGASPTAASMAEPSTAASAVNAANAVSAARTTNANTPATNAVNTPAAIASAVAATYGQQCLSEEQIEQLRSYRQEQMNSWLQSTREQNTSEVNDTWDAKFLANSDFDPHKAMAAILAKSYSLASATNSSAALAPPPATEDASHTAIEGSEAIEGTDNAVTNTTATNNAAAVPAAAVSTANAAKDGSETTGDPTETLSNTATTATDGNTVAVANTANQASTANTAPMAAAGDGAAATSQAGVDTNARGAQTSSLVQSIHCTWQDVEFMDMPIPERFTLLKPRVTLKQLETGRGWLRQLLSLPNKIAFTTYLAADGTYKTKLKVYFAAQDQDYKAFCKKRAEQRKENNKRKIRASAALARQSLKAKA